MLNGSPAVVAAVRMRDLFRHVAAVALCALVAHSVAYGSLVPEDGAHQYFGWYAPLVAVLSGVSILGTLVALVVALASGPESTPAVLIRSILPRGSTDCSLVARLFGLASGALVFLAVQESLERSLAEGRFALVSFAPPTLAVLLTVVLVAATVVALAERAASSLADAVLRAARAVPRKPARLSHRPARVVRRTRLRPLTIHGGLRAPPLLA